MFFNSVLIMQQKPRRISFKRSAAPPDHQPFLCAHFQTLENAQKFRPHFQDSKTGRL